MGTVLHGHLQVLMDEIVWPALTRDLRHGLSMGCRLSQDDQKMSLMRRIFSYFRNPVSLYH